MLAEAGLPDGALEVCHCPVPLAEQLVRDERIAMVSFTGSAAVGWHIKSIAGRKKVALELGGNGAVIVAEDADLDHAKEMQCASLSHASCYFEAWPETSPASDAHH